MQEVLQLVAGVECETDDGIANSWYMEGGEKGSRRSCWLLQVWYR